MFRKRFTSGTLQRKRRRRAVRLFYFYAVISVLFVSLFAWVIRLPGININSIEVIGNSIEKKEVLKNFVNERLSETYFFLIPKTSIFFYPSSLIERDLMDSFKRLEYADLSFGDFDSILLEVKERQPEFIWCPDVESSDCYFTDKGGFLFVSAPGFSGDVYLKFLGGIGTSSPLGQTVSFSWPFETLKSFLSSIEEKWFKPIAVESIGNGDVAVLIEGDRKILINEENDLESILTDLGSVLDSEVFTEASFDFEYIDLRFKNKVFYKLVR